MIHLLIPLASFICVALMLLIIDSARVNRERRRKLLQYRRSQTHYYRNRGR